MVSTNICLGSPHFYLTMAGVAPNSTALIVGRAIAGLGGAGIASGAYILVAYAVKPQARAAFTGILGAAYGIASVAGPLIGGVFAEKVSCKMIAPFLHPPQYHRTKALSRLAETEVDVTFTSHKERDISYLVSFSAHRSTAFVFLA